VRPLPTVQIVGYRLLGLSVVVSGLALFAAVLYKLRGSPLGVDEAPALVLAGAMSTAFLWYGSYLFK